MLVTLLGIVILVKLVHPLKVFSPILVTLSGIVTLVKLVHPLKAYALMLTVPSLNVQDVIPLDVAV